MSYNKDFVNRFFEHVVSAYSNREAIDLKEKLLNLEKKVIQLKDKDYSEEKITLLQNRIEKLKGII